MCLPSAFLISTVLAGPVQGGGGGCFGFGNFPTAKPQDSPCGGHDKGCVQSLRGSPTSLAESQGSPAPSAGWARRDQTERLLLRSLARLPSLSPASPTTISSVRSALPLAEPKLPLPPAAHTHTHAHTLAHTLAHGRHTVPQTHRTQAHTG